LFVHDRVNVVFCVIVTSVDWFCVTGPTPLSMLHVGGGYGGLRYAQFHVIAACVFAGITDGVAVNATSCGVMPGASGIAVSATLASAGCSPPSSHPTIANVRRSMCIRMVDLLQITGIDAVPSQ
jgi:hypothetical protein